MKIKQIMVCVVASCLVLMYSVCVSCVYSMCVVCIVCTMWVSSCLVLMYSVPAFEATKYLITNREFLQFVQEGCYSNRSLWSEEGALPDLSLTTPVM